MRLYGLLSLPLTPFTPKDKVDLAALAGHVQRQIEHGPSALFVARGTGGFTARSLEEYRQVVTTAVEVAASRAAARPECDLGGRDVLETPLSIVDGVVAVPSGPGLGVRLDRDQLARLASRYAVWDSAAR